MNEWVLDWRAPATSALRRVATVAFVAAILTGCASSSSTVKPAELTDFRASLNVATTWRVSVGSARGNFLQPAVVENAVFAAAADGTLLRVDPRTGAAVWRASVEAPIAAGVGSDGFTVAVATPRGEVIAYDAEGKARWRAQAPSDVIAPPLVGRGLVVVRSTDHRLTAFEADSGKRRWSYQRQSPALTLRASSEMAFAGDSIVAGFPGGRLVSLALANGAARWEAIVSEPKGTTEVERLADVVGPVAVDERDVCAAAYQGRVMCADRSSGNLRWAREMSARGGVSLAPRAAYSVDNTSAVVAYARDGASLWRNTKLAHRAVTTPLALADAAIVGDYKGYVHVLAAGDGNFVARMQVDSSAIVARPIAWADGAIVQTQDGTLALLTPQR